jgi:exopolysaccharide biosynthesis polyprenyl glycosylphosphotransferase
LSDVTLREYAPPRESLVSGGGVTVTLPEFRQERDHRRDDRISAPNLTLPEPQIASLGSTPTPAWYPRYKRIILALDVAVLAIVIAATFGWRMTHPDTFAGSIDPITYTIGALGLLGLWVFLLSTQRSRARSCVGVGIVEYQRVVKASLWLFGLVALFSYIFQVPVARFMFITTLPIGVVTLVAERWAARTYLNRNRAKLGRFMTPTLLIGTGADITMIVHDLTKVRGAGYRPVAACLVDGDEYSLSPDARALSRVELSDVTRRLGNQGIGAVMILGGLDKKQTRRIAWNLEKSPVEFILQSSLTDLAGPRISTQAAEALNLVHVDLPKYDGWELVLKRAFDIIFSAFALVVTSPIMAAVAIAIKINDPKGPVIFRQERIGKDGEPFMIHKFRTMCVDAEKQLDALIWQQGGQKTLFKMEDDPRVTSVGRVLRKYSLDEFPQFWDSFLGKMSVVGPRPALPREVEVYKNTHLRRLIVKPGITGLWQTSGRSNLTLEESIRVDLRYVENWSLLTDILLIIKTMTVALRGSGGY